MAPLFLRCIASPASSSIAISFRGSPTPPPLAARLPARAGQTLSLEFSWRSDADGQEDHAQYLHLGHAESGEWQVYEQAPLRALLPTRLWYKGLADSETLQVPPPSDLAPGRYAFFSGLYRTRDKERIPARAPEGDYFLDARAPLGSLVVA